MPKAKAATKSVGPKRKACEVRFQRSCRGTAFARLAGVKAGDPTFWCCLACQAELRRMRVRTKVVTDG